MKTILCLRVTGLMMIIKRMIEIYSSVKKQGFKIKIYMYLSTYMLYEPLLYDIYCEDGI